MNKQILALLLLFIGSAKLIALSQSNCLNITGKALILVDSNTVKLYPKLKVGTEIQRGVYVANVSKLLPSFEGWLPAALVKVDHKQLAACKANHFPVFKSCSGTNYCLVPISQISLFIYHGNFTKRVLSVFNGIPKGLGNPKSKIWILALLDPFCPYCAIFYTKGGGTTLESMIRENKIYYIPVIVAFHTNAKGYEQSLALAYVLQGKATNNDTKAFFDLEREIAKNLRDLYFGKKKLVNIIDVLQGPAKSLNNIKVSRERLVQELLKWNERQMRKATRLFPTIATPATIFLNTKTGYAITLMGAQSPQAIQKIYQLVTQGK